MVSLELIKKKSILKMTLLPEDGVTPKHKGEVSRTKYFVVIGLENDRILVGSVLINSIINEKLFFRIADFQYRISRSGYTFLTKEESYINCYDVKEIPLDRIIKEAEYIGELLDEDFVCIKNLLHKSPVIRPAVLKKYHMK